LLGFCAGTFGSRLIITAENKTPRRTGAFELGAVIEKVQNPDQEPLGLISV
jgi:hypothetical protein